MVVEERRKTVTRQPEAYTAPPAAPNRAQRRAEPRVPQSAGFRPQPNATATLKFSGDYEGAVIECSLDASVDFYLELVRSGPEAETQEQSFERTARRLQRFGDELLLEWNYVDNNGEPVPATGAGILQAPAAFSSAILEAWIEAKVGVSAPLDDESNSSGAALPERSIPMETLSGSRQN